MWMNEAEIEWAAQQRHACPNVRKGVRLLHRLVQAVNDQSDGWPYWKAPAQAAGPLMTLLSDVGNLQHGTTGTISTADFKKAVALIKDMAIEQKEVQARFGNKFEFDVEAALR